MPYADLKSLRLYYENYQPADTELSSNEIHPRINVPLVLLHGFTLDRRMWAPQAAFLANSFRVILLDARGHGLSDAPETGYSRAHRVEDLQRFVDYLQIEQFHLVGLSMGGSTGIGYALQHQDQLASLILAGTGAAGYDIGKEISLVDQLARERGPAAARQKWKKIALAWYKQDKKDLRELMERMIDEHSGAVWRDPMLGLYRRENDLEIVHTIKVPTKIIVGGADRVFVRLAKLLHEKIPNSRLSVYEGIGHMVNLEAPERFNQELKQFLEGCVECPS